MLTFLKLLLKFLELWRNIGEGTIMAENMLDSIDEVRSSIERLIEDING